MLLSLVLIALCCFSALVVALAHCDAASAAIIIVDGKANYADAEDGKMLLKMKKNCRMLANDGTFNFRPFQMRVAFLERA